MSGQAVSSKAREVLMPLYKALEEHGCRAAVAPYPSRMNSSPALDLGQLEMDASLLFRLQGQWWPNVVLTTSLQSMFLHTETGVL